MIELNCIKSLNGANGKFDLDVNLNVKKGEFVALCGKSGSGKTTLLRLIAGFETPDSGTIKAGAQTLFDGKNFTPPQNRNIGFLFQDYALFPNMNVMKNLLFANIIVSAVIEYQTCRIFFFLRTFTTSGLPFITFI